MKKLILLILLFMGSNLSKILAQDWLTTGNTITGTQWFGATSSSSIPLNIEHKANNFPIYFKTTINGATNNRMVISNNPSGHPRIGIGGTVVNPSMWHYPASRLHIGGQTYNSTGYRTWMDIGTFYGSQQGTDNMYVGLKALKDDVHEAIINWGNNPVGFNYADRLRFVFTASDQIGDGIADKPDGLEIGRMVAINTGGINPVIEPRFGVGNFFTGNIGDPKTTLDVNGQV